MRIRTISLLLALLVISGMAIDSFTIERFPPPQFEGDYVKPGMTAPPPRAGVWPVIDASVLVITLCLASWFALKKRSRTMIFCLMIFSLVYFGFYRKGCVCPIGSIQDISLLIFRADHAIPMITIFFFIMPLIATLLFGRGFCAGVCPLGAVQDLTLIKPVKVPSWLEHTLRYLAYIYLAIAILLAVNGSAFVICKYDPYVAIFRQNANLDMVIIGGILLVTGFFIGRPYCRFLCPYGVILRQLSRFSKWRVRITPTDCNQCRLCEDACPYGAIRQPVQEWPQTTHAADKKRLALLLVLLPVIAIAGSWIGNAIAPLAARTHATVSLAEQVWVEENMPDTLTTDASEFFRSSGESIPSLYERAALVRERFEKGGWFLGGFLGLILGGKLIMLSLRPRQKDYEADRAGCVSCGRCYRYCPKEQEYRLVKIQESGGVAADDE
ncbi:MAG: 4Fe-4S binding protein [Desulfatiglans sp.]|nr:4Fe-4S binding protein [Desulfatiglans sp.]